MERLTNKREADAQRKDYSNRIKNGYPRCIPEERFLRLADYEDTGLTPEQVSTAKVLIDATFAKDTSKIERIRELMKADKEGRVVVLTERPERQSPCDWCSDGWGTSTTEGMHGCHETCERLREYEEAEKALEAKKDG